MKFQELKLVDRFITSSTFEFTFAMRDTVLYSVGGEYDASVTVDDFAGSYEEPPHTEVEVTSFDLDFESIEIYDIIKDAETDITPSKYLLDLIEEELHDYIHSNYEDFEEDYDRSDYYDYE